MKTLYFDCFAGISGDMTLGAFIDLGVDKEFLIDELNKLNVDGYKIEVSKKAKNGIMGTDVNVILLNEENHSHTHEEHVHSHENDHSHEHSHTHEHEHLNNTHSHIHIEHNHSHEHSHTYEHDHNHASEKNNHSHFHRSFNDIKELIEKSELKEEVKKLSVDIFYNVAKAEGKIHGKPLEEVHFHEVGAIDSIVDIVGAAICIDALEVDEIISSPLNNGTGTVKCQHGIIPLPAPATLEILKDGKVPVYSTGIKKELVTPTGAAIIATVAKKFEDIPNGIIKEIGYGCGKRNLDVANMLRVVIIEDNNVKKKVKSM